MSKPPMKLLWIFSTFGLDAPARRFASIAGRLGEEYEHVIGSMSGDFEAEALIPEGVNWRRVELSRSKRGGVSLTKMWNFRKTLTAERPDLLVTSNWESLEWLMINRGPGSAPHVHFEDPFGREEHLDDLDPKRAWGRRRAFPGRRRIFVASTREVERRFFELWGAPKDNVHHIPLGVDLELFPQRRHADHGGPLTIGSAGPLIPARRFDRLIRMTATLVERGRDVRAIILGEGPEKAALMTEAKTAGVADRIRFVGAERGCARVFSDMDAYVAAGDSERDASGLLAAMASGVPVVGLESDDLRDTVDPSNRLFIRPSGDESGMIAAAELIVSDVELRERLGRANRQRAESAYDLAVIAKRYDELFRETAGVSAFLALPAPDAIETDKSDKKHAAGDAPTDKSSEAKEARPMSKAAKKLRQASDAAVQRMQKRDAAPINGALPVVNVKPVEASTPEKSDSWRRPAKAKKAPTDGSRRPQA